MNQRVLALLLVACIALFALSACKKGGSAAGENGTTASQSTEAASKKGSETTTQAGEEAGENNGSSNSAEAGEASTSATTEKSGKNTDGWQQQEGGNIIKGDVKVNVVKYGGTTLADGEQLIQELIEGGLDNAKILATQKSDNSVIYKASGTRIGSKTAEYVKFQFVLEKGTGYLVTVMAESEKGLDSDISYILSNLAALAQ